jgi:hypothetical protein
MAIPAYRAEREGNEREAAEMMGMERKQVAIKY